MNNSSSIFRILCGNIFHSLSAFNQYLTCIKYTIIFKAFLEHQLLYAHGHSVLGKFDNLHLTKEKQTHRSFKLAQSHLVLQTN